jgi:PEP-CTERM motif
VILRDVPPEGLRRAIHGQGTLNTSWREIQPTSIGVGIDQPSIGDLHMDKQFYIRGRFRTRSRLACWAICAVCVVFGGWANGARGGIITIDDFNSSYQFFKVSQGMNTAMEMTQSTPTAIGGQRDMLINVVGQAKPNTAVGFVGQDPTGPPYFPASAMELGTNGLAPTVTTLQYSGIDNSNTSASLVNAHALGGGLGIDLTNGGSNDRFFLHFFSSDAQPTSGLDVAITITSPGGKTSKATTIGPNAMTAFDVFVSFSSLVGNATTHHVDSIIFVFNGVNHTNNIDYEVQLLGTVPEPASGTLMMTALGVLGLAARQSRWRRHCKSNCLPNSV